MNNNGLIWNVLPVGAENAIHASIVAQLVGLNSRQDVSHQVDKEHRDGFPICSNQHGYFRPSNNDELLQYINRRKHRARQIAAGTALLMKHMGEGQEQVKVGKIHGKRK